MKFDKIFVFMWKSTVSSIEWDLIRACAQIRQTKRLLFFECIYWNNWAHALHGPPKKQNKTANSLFMNYESIKFERNIKLLDLVNGNQFVFVWSGWFHTTFLHWMFAFFFACGVFFLSLRIFVLFCCFLCTWVRTKKIKFS